MLCIPLTDYKRVGWTKMTMQGVDKDVYKRLRKCKSFLVLTIKKNAQEVEFQSEKGTG